MSTFLTVSEEITINQTDKKTEFVTRLLKLYMSQFFYMQRVRELEIDFMELTVNGDTHRIEYFKVNEEGVFESVREGENLGEWAQIDSDDSEYWRIFFQYNTMGEMWDKIRKVSFKVHYRAYCCLGAAMGIDYWANALDVLDSENLRENVSYKGIEETGSDEWLRAYRYDQEHQGFCGYDQSYAAMPVGADWELDSNATISWYEEEGENPFESPDRIREMIEKIRPLVENYGVEIEDYNEGDTDIFLSGCILIGTEGLDDFFADFQKLLDIIAHYKCLIGSYEDHLVSREFGSFASIRLGYDDYKLKPTYMRV